MAKMSGLDAVVRDAAEQNEGDASEFDTIARYRGMAQENAANLLTGHVRGHGANKQQGGKDIADKVDELKGHDADRSASEPGSADELHQSSDAARERVFQSNDKTYDAINEAKTAVQRKFEEAKQGASQPADPEDVGSYAAINEAKEMLKDKYDSARDRFEPGDEETNKSDEAKPSEHSTLGSTEEQQKRKGSAGEKLSSVTQAIKEVIAGK